MRRRFIGGAVPPVFLPVRIHFRLYAGDDDEQGVLQLHDRLVESFFVFLRLHERPLAQRPGIDPLLDFDEPVQLPRRLGQQSVSIASFGAWT